MIIRLKRHHASLLEEEASKVHPIEACAMLFGRISGEEVVIAKVVVALNELQSNVRFEINPETFAQAYTEASNEGMDFVGLFHSHPAPAVPSSIDLRYMKLWGDAIWLILSSTDSTLAAYQMRDGRVIEIAIRVE